MKDQSTIPTNNEDFKTKTFIELSSEPDVTRRHFEIAGEVISIPHLVLGIFQIVNHLQKVIPLCDEIDTDVFQQLKGVREWARHIDSIHHDHPWAEAPHLNSGDSVTEEIDGVKFERLIQKLRPLNTRYPLWTTLWYRSGSIKNQDRTDTYHRLQAYYLVATILTDQRPIEGRLKNRVSNQIKISGQWLRKIHFPELVAELNYFIGVVEDLPTLHNQLRSYHTKRRDNKIAGSGYFADFLKIAFGLKTGWVINERHRILGYTHGYDRRKKALIIGDNHSLYVVFDRYMEKRHGDSTNTIPILIDAVGKKHSEKLADGGLAPEEYMEEVEIWLEIGDLGGVSEEEIAQVKDGTIDRKKLLSKLRALPPLGALFEAANARARHIIMDAQRLTTRSNRIPLPQLAKLFSALDNFFIEASGSDAPKTRFLAETLLLIAVSIVTGTPYNKLINLGNINSREEIPEKYDLVYSSHYRVWVRPYRMPKRHPLSKAFLAETIDSVPRIILGDYFEIGKRLQALENGQWFKHTADTFQKTYNKIIRPRLESAGIEPTWLQLSRIDNLIPQWMLGMEEGDQLMVSAIFDRDDRLASVHKFYTAFDRRVVEDRYFELLKQLREGLIFNGYTPSGNGLLGWATGRPKLPEDWAGDDWVLESEAVHEVVDHYQRLLEPGVDYNGSRSDLWVFHNHFTTYVALIVSLVTGFRSVRTPVVDLTLLDRENGFLPLQEKDRADGSHARIVYLPPRVQAMVDHYQEHLHQLLMQLPISFSGVLEVAATKARDKRIAEKTGYNHQKYLLYLNRTYCYISEDEVGGLEYLELTGNRMRDCINHELPGIWPVDNESRHFLRTWLANRGCPSTIINTHMGHWHLGEESWGTFSALDPWHYREEISVHLEALLKEVGFRSVGPCAGSPCRA